LKAMSKSKLILIYALVVVVEIILRNFLNLSQYLTVAMTPVLIMCLPKKVGTIETMLIAFVIGFVLDFFTSSILGLTIIALLPVAVLRNIIYLVCFESENYSRMKGISIKRQGIPRVSAVMLIALAIYLIIFIWIDSAGTRPFMFNVLRFVVSLIVGYVLSFVSINLIESE